MDDNPNADERERYIGRNGPHVLAMLAAIAHCNNSPGIDPDNPPLTGREAWKPGRPHILSKIAAHKAKI